MKEIASGDRCRLIKMNSEYNICVFSFSSYLSFTQLNPQMVKLVEFSLEQKVAAWSLEDKRTGDLSDRQDNSREHVTLDQRYAPRR